MAVLYFIYWVGLTIYSISEITRGHHGAWFAFSAAGLLLVAASREAGRQQ